MTAAFQDFTHHHPLLTGFDVAISLALTVIVRAAAHVLEHVEL